MKIKSVYLIVSVLICVSSWRALAQEPKTVSSKLGEATVFFKGAELTHFATVTLQKGENEIRVEGLSPEVDINSLKIKATNNAMVSAFEFSIDYLSAAKSLTPVLKKIEDSISVYQAALEKVNIDLKINTNVMTQLQAGVSKNVSGSEKGLGIDELVKTMDYYKSKSGEMEANQAALNKQKRRLEDSIKRLKAQLDQESVKGNRTSGVLKLSLSAPAAGNTALTITYYTPSASWQPYYDIHITAADKPIEIAAKSKVRQTTGLDWEKIKLNLSTATPGNGKTAPLFSVWFLEPRRPAIIHNEALMLQNAYSYDLSQPLAVKELVHAPEKKIRGMVSDGSVSTSLDIIPQKRSMDDYITESENVMNVVYNIDLPYTIPGNGKEQNIDLQKKEVPAEFKYYCAPKLDPQTYLLAEVADWEKLGLLSGKANLTYDGTYVGDTYIDASSTQSKLSLSLGTDRRVTVKREKMQDFSSSKFLGNDIQQVFTYKLSVKNNQNRPVKMVLKDQYPISTQKNIEVLLRKETTPWTVNKEDVGVLTWEEEFAAGETRVYQISYSVKYPKDMELNL